MKKKISTVRHKGIITDISPQEIKVEILNKSMCSACHASAFCSLSEMKRKIITIYPPFGAQFSQGEEVELLLREKLGLKAVWISYVIPLIILLILLLSLPMFGISELLAGLLSIFAVGVYYLIVYLFRHKIAKEFTFTIEKHN